MSFFFPFFIFSSPPPQPIINHSSSYDYFYDYYREKREKEEYEEMQRKLQVNLNFNKDFDEYFKKQMKDIKEQITPDLFQIEPYNIEEMSNLINLIIEEEKYEEKLFNEVKKIVSENAGKNKLVKHLNIILAGPTGVENLHL